MESSVRTKNNMAEMKLFDHQKSGIAFLKKNKKAILADEMGLGKTIQAIKAVEDHGNTIVICPASLKINWQREIRSARPWDRITILNGRTLNQEKQEEAEKSKWIIINYDVISYHKEWIGKIVKQDHIQNVILDEAHYIKGRSIRAKATIEIVKEADRVYCLTGTPLLNRPIELWNLLVAIEHPITIKKGARSRFSTMFCGGHLRTLIRRFGPPIRFWDESGATNLNILRSYLIECMIRRKKNEVLNLPAKIIDVIEVKMKPDQRKEYENAWDSYMEYLKLNPPENIKNIVATRQLVEIQKLKQVCSRAKVDQIVTDAQNAIEQGSKVIVFTQYVKTLESIKAGMKKIKYDSGSTDSYGKPKMETIDVAVLSGATKQNDRQKAVDSFQENERVKVFIANIKAGGVGITLTEASIVIFADMDWTPEVHSQAEDRAHRIGQNRMVNVYYYVAQDTIEMDIIELLAKKKQMVNEVIDGTKDRVQSKSILPDFIRRMSERKKLST